MNFKNREFSISFNIDIDDIEEPNNKNKIVIQCIRIELGLLYYTESGKIFDRDCKKNCMTTIIQGYIPYVIDMMISSSSIRCMHHYYIITDEVSLDKIPMPSAPLSSIVSILKAKQNESRNE